MKKLSFSVLLFLLLVTTLSSTVGANELANSTSESKLKTANSQLKNQLNSAREDFKDKIEKAHEDFKMRLGEIKDARKKAVAEKLNTAFNNINKNRTAEFNRHLVRLTNILDRIETRKNKAKASGKDVASVETAIAKARLAIESAQTAVTTQTGKDYTISFTNESNLGQGAKNTRSQLRQDLDVVWVKVKAARKAVEDAFKSLKTVSDNDDNQSTGSAEANH